jgi:hypothetical protein
MLVPIVTNFRGCQPWEDLHTNTFQQAEFHQSRERPLPLRLLNHLIRALQQ